MLILKFIQRQPPQTFLNVITNGMNKNDFPSKVNISVYKVLLFLTFLSFSLRCIYFIFDEILIVSSFEETSIVLLIILNEVLAECTPALIRLIKDEPNSHVNIYNILIYHNSLKGIWY